MSLFACDNFVVASYYAWRRAEAVLCVPAMGYDLRELIKLNIYLYFIHECDRAAFQQQQATTVRNAVFNQSNQPPTELRLNEKIRVGLDVSLIRSLVAGLFIMCAVCVRTVGPERERGKAQQQSLSRN